MLRLHTLVKELIKIACEKVKRRLRVRNKQAARPSTKKRSLWGRNSVKLHIIPSIRGSLAPRSILMSQKRRTRVGTIPNEPDEQVIFHCNMLCTLYIFWQVDAFVVSSAYISNCRRSPDHASDQSRFHSLCEEFCFLRNVLNMFRFRMKRCK